jgi:hypothetical protein
MQQSLGSTACGTLCAHLQSRRNHPPSGILVSRALVMFWPEGWVPRATASDLLLSALTASSSVGAGTLAAALVAIDFNSYRGQQQQPDHVSLTNRASGDTEEPSRFRWDRSVLVQAVATSPTCASAMVTACVTELRDLSPDAISRVWPAVSAFLTYVMLCNPVRMEARMSLFLV